MPGTAGEPGLGLPRMSVIASQLLRRRALALALMVVPLAACGQQSQKGKQLDITLRFAAGSGTGSTALEHFPHARYTFFTYGDPAGCVLGVRLLDKAGGFVAGDARDQQPPAGASPETAHPGPVQKDVQDGLYRVYVGTNMARCHWAVDEVLNSMSSDDSPPAPASPPRAPALDSRIDSGAVNPVVNVPVAGVYNVNYRLTAPLTASCQYSVGLRNAMGDFEPIAAGAPMLGQPIGLPPGVSTGTPYAPPASVDVGVGGPVYLVSGRREVSVDTTCSPATWELSISPWIGSIGGGTQGFRKS